MKHFKSDHRDTYHRELKKFFTLADVARNFKKLVGKLRIHQDKDEDGNTIYYRNFKHIQHIGAIIRDGKKAWRVISLPEMNRNKLFVNGEQQLIEIKIR